MKTLLLTLTLITSINIYAQQSVACYYDDAGNRIQRKQCACVGNRADNPTDATANTLAANILPNPTKGNLAIEVMELEDANNQEDIVTDTEATHFHVFVYDLYGREIVNQQHITAKFNIDITQQPPGTYFVKLIANNKIKQWEIIKK